MHLNDHVEGLRAILAEETARADQLRAQIAEVQENMKRLTRAITALTGEETTAAPKTVKKMRSRERKAWNPSDEALTRVIEVFRNDPEVRLPLGDIASQAAQSTTTTKRCLTVLREREIVRPAGTIKGSRGAPRTLYALTPNGAAVDNS